MAYAIAVITLSANTHISQVMPVYHRGSLWKGLREPLEPYNEICLNNIPTIHSISNSLMSWGNVGSGASGGFDASSDRSSVGCASGYSTCCRQPSRTRWWSLRCLRRIGALAQKSTCYSSLLFDTFDLSFFVGPVRSEFPPSLRLRCRGRLSYSLISVVSLQCLR